MDSDDELELIEEHDLEASSQDSRSDIESSRRRNKKNSTTNTSTSRRRRRKLGPNDDPFASDNDSLISASDQDPDPYNPDNQQDQEAEQDEEATRDSHFQLLKSTVIDITSALGGIEERLDDRDRIVKEYVIGDDCLRCLRDLRTLWRQDDHDSSRLIPRVFSEVNVLQNGLIPLLLKVAGTDERGSKIALACTDLLTAITWPMDAMAELANAINNEDDPKTMQFLPALERALVTYKASILRVRSEETHLKGSKGRDRDVLSLVMREILLPCLQKPRPLRNERDIGTISMCLHLFRNLLAIKDPIATTLSSADAIANSTLQSALIVSMDKAFILETILMLASSAETRDFEAWNAVASDCVFHIFSGSSPRVLALGSEARLVGSNLIKEVGKKKEVQEVGEDDEFEDIFGSTKKEKPAAKKPISEFGAFLAAEAAQERHRISVSGTARHSRFAGSFTFTGSTGRKLVSTDPNTLRKSLQQLRDEADLKTKRVFRRKKTMQERGAPRPKTEWTRDARRLLKEWADKFMQDGFETLTRSVLKDIRSEREKMGDLDEARIRVMYLGGFFLEYFLIRRENTPRPSSSSTPTSKPRPAAKEVQLQGEGSTETQQEASSPSLEKDKEIEKEKDPWPATMIGEWLEPWAFKMVTLRSHDSLDNKNWLEFVTSVQLWTVLLRLVDLLSRSDNKDEAEAAEGLQGQLYYQSEALETCKMVANSYKSQSFTCLENIISFSYFMPKMLERYASDKENMFVRAKKRARNARKKALEDGDEEAAEEAMRGGDEAIKEKAEDMFTERRFQFQHFQSRLTTRKLADACVTYLGRWREYSEPGEHLSRVVGVMHRIAIKAQDYRAFFPAPHRTAFRAILVSPLFSSLEVYNKTATSDLKKLLEFILKKFDKLDQEEQTKWATAKHPRGQAKPPKLPAEITCKFGVDSTEQFGVAVGLLLSKEKMKYVLWVKNALEMASAQRAEIVASVDGDLEQGRAAPMDVDSDDSDDETLESRRKKGHLPSNDALDKFEPLVLKYEGDADLEEDATKMPELKLLCRLANLESKENETGPWTWSVPARTLPAHLDADIETIENFIRDPLDTHGLELSSYVQKVRKQRVSKPKAIKSTTANNDDDLQTASSNSSSSSSSDSDSDNATFNEKLKNKKKSREEQSKSKSKKESSSSAPKVKRRMIKKKTSRPAPKKKEAGRPQWTANDFIEDSEEERAIVDRLWNERAAREKAEAEAAEAAGSDGEVGGSGNNSLPIPPKTSRAANDSDADSDDDDSPTSSSPNRHSSPIASRPKPKSKSKSKAAAASSSRSRRSEEESTPPTSSPKSQAQNNPKRSGALFLGNDGSDEEVDELESDGDKDKDGDQVMSSPTPASKGRASSPSNSVSTSASPVQSKIVKSQAKRAAIVDSDEDEEEVERPTQRRRQVLVDSDDE